MTATIKIDAKYVQEDSARLIFGRYQDGSIAMLLESAGTGERLCTATVCLTAYGEKPRDGNVFIKDYSENEGVLNALQKAGVVGDVIRSVPAGYATVYECKLLVDAVFYQPYI